MLSTLVVDIAIFRIITVFDPSPLSVYKLQFLRLYLLFYYQF